MMQTAVSLSPARYLDVIRTLFWLTLFSIAMGFLETSVVVYLRQLYYPGGFGFPLVEVSHSIATTEFYREVATMIMLLGAGIMAGKNAQQRFVFFLYCFAIWDIFYYVFLYVLLGWPQSLFTWDILFLIPVPWVGPVLCPVLVSLTMVALTFVTLYGQWKGNTAKLARVEKLMLLSGCAVILVSFMWDYFQYVKLHGEGKTVWTLSSDKELFSEARGYVPTQFNWLLFWCGQIILAGGVLVFGLRMHRWKKMA
jgi:hypothetical protein